MSDHEPDGNRNVSSGTHVTDGGTDYEIADSVRLGGVVYALVGLGAFVTTFLVGVLGDTDSSYFPNLSGEAGFRGDEALYYASAEAYVLVVALAAVLAIAIGYLYHRSNRVGDESPKFAAIAAAVGTAIILILLLLLLLIFEPDGVDVDLGDEITVVLAATIASGLFGAVTAYVFDNVVE